MDEETLDGIDLVKAVICSLDGGVNGLNIERTLSILEQEDGSIRYVLVDLEGVEQVFTVTVAEYA